MLTMGTDVTRWFVQTTTQLHRTYQAWVGAMKGTKVGLRRQISPTKDTFGNALWLWARAQPAEKLAEMLEPYMDEFDKLWASREGGEPASPAWNPGSERTFPNLGPKLPPKPRREPEAPPTEPPVRVSGKLPPKKTKSG